MQTDICTLSRMGFSLSPMAHFTEQVFLFRLFLCLRHTGRHKSSFERRRLKSAVAYARVYRENEALFPIGGICRR
jgi:hypothetical protein